MNSRADISVALCTYNGERYLDAQLESIARQTVLPYELVVSDDGSNDRTLDILREFSQKAPFHVNITRNSENLGSTKNFEHAIRLCRGQFIALCDQDDWWAPEKLDVLSDILLSSHAGAVFSDALLMDAQSDLVGKTLWGSIEFNRSVRAFGDTSGRSERISELLRRNVVTGAAAMIRADCCQIALPIPAVWVHDGWLAWMMVLHSTIIACPRPLIHYRIHNNQQVGTAAGSVAQILRRSRASGGGKYHRQGDQFQVLLDYVKQHPEIDGRDLQKRITEKRDFMFFRSGLGRARSLPWGAIIGRFRQYQSYALGLRSMVLDALR